VTAAPSKADIVKEICQRIGLRQTLHMSTGSTEPRELFIEIDNAFGLGITSRANTKPELASAIVNAAGFAWLPQFESRGSTITREGLLAVLDAVLFFKGDTPDQ